MLKEYLSKLNDIVDPEHVARSRDRMRALVCFGPVDRLPLAVHCPVEGWPLDEGIPEGATTGMTLSTVAADLETAKQVALG